MAYLDWNATAPLLPEARAAWIEASERYWANPSTPYRAGTRARLALDEARESVAGLLRVRAEQVVFTSGATESNNGFLQAAALRARRDAAVWVSAVEHPSVRLAAPAVWGAGRVVTIPVGSSGQVDAEWLRARLARERPALVSVMLVNNETGVIQPWREIMELCAGAGVPFHCDAVQWMGKLPVDEFPWTACAGITFSGHKLGGPRGVGCLVIGPDWEGIKVMTGGAQEHGHRAGTENLPGILGMVAALRHRCANPPGADAMRARDRFEAGLEELWPGEVVVHGRGAPRVWNTCMVSLPAHRAARWISRLDQHGFQVSSGSACSSAKAGHSGVFAAMGVDEATATRAVRISAGWETGPHDWSLLLDTLRVVRRSLDERPDAGGPATVIEV